MLRTAIVRIIAFCTRYPRWVIAAALLLSAVSTVYSVRHFAIQTDVNRLFPSDLPWTRRAFEYMRAFPQADILAVVDAPTSELVERAARRLADTLAERKDVIRAVYEPQGGSFFTHNSLLYLPRPELARLSGALLQADPLLAQLSADPSLRGALGVLSGMLMGVEGGTVGLADLVRPMTMAADTAEGALAGRPASFSWRALATGKAPSVGELRRFIEIVPVLDYKALEPGRAATDAVEAAAKTLKLASRDEARVRLTGLVPINDDEFATLSRNAIIGIAAVLLAVLFILRLALRSPRIILAVVASLVVGLSLSAALGLFLVGALNVISIAFFVLFIGLGVDFGIQFGVRYRAERYEFGDLHPALLSAGRKAGVPLALAAAATAVGFSAFLPTAYRGLSELGEIAGGGMIVAFLTSITLLPALLQVLNPPGEPHPMGFAALAPVDRFLERHRRAVVGSTVAAVVLAAPLLWFLPFDFNPLHLRDPKAPSVATFLELRKDPRAGANAIDLLAPNLDAANEIAGRLAALPQVLQVSTLSNLIPRHQHEKIATMGKAAIALDNALYPQHTPPPPSDADNVAALKRTAGDLASLAATHKGAGGRAAGRLGKDLEQLAKASPAVRARAQDAVVKPLAISLDDLRQALDPQWVTPKAIPPEVARQWLTPRGRARVEVLPKGDPDDTALLRRFVAAVLAVEPDATGPAVQLYEAGNTVVRAFFEAGGFALLAIAVLLWIALRRISDVLLTLVPLVIAGVVTLELCVVFGLRLNFADIIALPLLLGVGVAFKIYYMTAWRSGKTALVQSSLTRAVIFSAMTTATAFGSLWLSSDPGTSSMGQLMALALACTMAAAVLFQPALMGPPRQRAEAPPAAGSEPPAPVADAAADAEPVAAGAFERARRRR
ncbi:MAG TPA: MMPL family transporter [Stellaceae bacterium]|nr:MMPL family transporter [Stellaceae bacterium]